MSPLKLASILAVLTSALALRQKCELSVELDKYKAVFCRYSANRAACKVVRASLVTSQQTAQDRCQEISLPAADYGQAGNGYLTARFCLGENLKGTGRLAPKAEPRFCRQGLSGALLRSQKAVRLSDRQLANLTGRRFESKTIKSARVLQSGSDDGSEDRLGQDHREMGGMPPHGGPAQGGQNQGPNGAPVPRPDAPPQPTNQTNTSSLPLNSSSTATNTSNNGNNTGNNSNGTPMTDPNPSVGFRDHSHDGPDMRLVLGLILGLVIPAVVVALAIIMCCCVKYRKRRASADVPAAGALYPIGHEGHVASENKLVAGGKDNQITIKTGPRGDELTQTNAFTESGQEGAYPYIPQVDDDEKFVAKKVGTKAGIKINDEFKEV